MKFRTVSGSIYEIEQENNRIRRLFGIREPIKGQGLDGEWKEYLIISTPQIGKSLCVTWKTPKSESSGMMITSRIVEFLLEKGN